jgi:hypothetical protein
MLGAPKSGYQVGADMREAARAYDISARIELDDEGRDLCQTTLKSFQAEKAWREEPNK